MSKRNEPSIGESTVGAIRSSGDHFGKRPHSAAAAMPDLESSAMHRLSHLYAAVAREPVPRALAALLKRLRT
jgi:hypothetical protein